jgi:hypothetical protein
MHSILWISVTIRTFIGDFFLLKDFLYLGDSTFCRIQVGTIFFFTSLMFHSFLLQAISRFINIIFISRLNTMKKCGMSLNGIWFYILLMILSWLVSFIVLIPACTVLDVFTYFPEQHHCLISFSNVRGFVYSLLVCYIIPVCPVIYIYSRVVIHIRQLPKRGVLLRTIREVTIIKHIVTMCVGISILGFPTLFFLFQFIITGQIHPLADRIHQLGLAINTIGFTSGFAILNSLIHVLPQLPFPHQRDPMIQMQEFSS